MGCSGLMLEGMEFTEMILLGMKRQGMNLLGMKSPSTLMEI
uniref:Uncharacterized protein n=1 Tax=Lepeophtheirus salmonis TaxID=72036 RepID=A0A0K2ULF1_LEPSM